MMVVIIIEGANPVLILLLAWAVIAVTSLFFKVFFLRDDHQRDPLLIAPGSHNPGAQLATQI